MALVNMGIDTVVSVMCQLYYGFCVFEFGGLCSNSQAKNLDRLSFIFLKTSAGKNTLKPIIPNQQVLKINYKAV
jgi:hypothetical protein